MQLHRLYVRETSGPFTRLRWGSVWLTQLVFYGLPWLQWHGRQAVLIDLPARKFYLFGLVLWPQDLPLLLALYLAFFFLLLLVTALAGRLWCGFACPHTVYTDIFMWVERKLEGSRTARMRLDQAPPGWSKFGKKLAKHTIWLAIALWTGMTLVGYATPIGALPGRLLQGAAGGWEVFFMTAYAAMAYLNAGWLRERICTSLCPYALFQGAMVDRHSLVVSYDRARGEPRGLRNRKRAAQAGSLGDCVDCTICVQVCPTGIDIRDGLQHACIGCAACIDACNAVMKKTGGTPGLVRFAPAHDPGHSVKP